MVCDLIQTRRISHNGFKIYLKNQKSEVKWFWWHIVSDISGYSCFEILEDNLRVGVFCVERCEIPHIDLYIGDDYRRHGVGLEMIKRLSVTHPTGRYKVNRRNEAGVIFYNQLASKKILKLGSEDSLFLNYHYNQLPASCSLGNR